MKITDGCVCDTETQNAYLREARYFVANSTTKLETREPACHCYIGTIIALLE